jgi:hypothetical protein
MSFNTIPPFPVSPASPCPSEKRNLQGFDFEAEGSHISKSKGDLKIDSDPIKIVNDKVRLIAMLDKDTAIRDTLQITLDYIANYQMQAPIQRRWPFPGSNR